MTTKSINKVVLYSIILLLLPGCSNDLDLFKPGPIIPIVYCIVNPCDSFCYVTLSKSVAAETDVTGILHNNSQMKIDDAEITLETWGSGYKLWETSFSLVKNGKPANDINSVSRSCYKSDRLLHFSNISLVGSDEKWDFDHLRLQISSPQLNNIAYARIPVIKGPGSVYPGRPMALNLYGQEESCFAVKLDKEETKYASFSCNFVFQEFTDHWESRNVHFIVKKDIAIILSADKILTIRLYEEFLNKLVVAITDNPNVYARRFDHMDFVLICSDEYFDDYFDTYLNVAAHDMRVYTNITNGYGLFSIARSTIFPPVKFDRQTLDSLCEGRITRHLNFKVW